MKPVRSLQYFAVIASVAACSAGVDDVGDQEAYSRASSLCFVGPSGASDACLSLVDWSSSWGSAYAYPTHVSANYRQPSRFIDLAVANANLALADDFVLSEVMQERKGRYGVFQPHVIELLQQIRDITGAALTINSAYRSPAYNASVGGATFSRHMYGDAADLKSSVVSLPALRSICTDLGAGYTALYATFIHCDWRSTPLNPRLFSFSEPDIADEGADALPEHTAELVLQADGVTWSAPATGYDEGEPLRTWTAYGSEGETIETVDSDEYAPPADAVWIKVVVGGDVELEVEL